MGKRYYVDADVLEGLGRDHMRARGDIDGLLRMCEGRVNSAPWRGWDQGAWWDIRNTVRHEIGLLENDNRALASRAAMVREKAKESPFARLKSWFDNLWRKATTWGRGSIDRLSKMAEVAATSARQQAWARLRSLQDLLARAEQLRQKASAWLAGLVGISGAIVLSITQRTWDLLNSMQRLVAEAERLRDKARASLERLAIIAVGSMIGAGQQAWRTVQAIGDQIANALTWFFPTDGWRVTTVRYSVTGPLHEFGIPASGKLEVTRTIKSRQNSDGTVTIVVTDEYELDLVEKGDLKLVEGSFEAGARITRERELTFASLAEGQLALTVIMAASNSAGPINPVLDLMSFGHLQRDSQTVSITGDVDAEVSDGLLALAGIEASGEAGLGGETRINEAGHPESVVYVDLGGSNSGHLLGLHGEISWDARLGLVTDGDHTYSELTVELTSQAGVSLVDLSTALGLDITAGSVDSYSSMTLHIVTPTGELADSVAEALRSGNLEAAVEQLSHGSHITVTAVQGVESGVLDVGFEQTPVPTVTVGGEVEVSTAYEQEIVLYDNRSAAAAGGGGGGGGGGAW